MNQFHFWHGMNLRLALERARKMDCKIRQNGHFFASHPSKLLPACSFDGHSRKCAPRCFTKWLIRLKKMLGLP